jgi:hypothetical protein
VDDSGPLIVSPLTTLLANGVPPDLLIDLLARGGITGLVPRDLKENPMDRFSPGERRTDEHSLRLLQAAGAVDAFFRSIGNYGAGWESLSSNQDLMMTMAASAARFLGAARAEEVMSALSIYGIEGVPLSLDDFIRSGFILMDSMIADPSLEIDSLLTLQPLLTLLTYTQMNILTGAVMEAVQTGTLPAVPAEGSFMVTWALPGSPAGGNSYLVEHIGASGSFSGSFSGGCVINSNGDFSTPPSLFELRKIFNWLGNTPIEIPADRGLLAGEPGGAAIVEPGSRSTWLGGVVSINADGSFHYRLDADSPHFHLTRDIPDIFEYSFSAGGETTMMLALVEIPNAVWYVDNSAAPGGNGSLELPFQTLSEAQTASRNGDCIFAFARGGSSGGLKGGIALKPGQKLIGEGTGLTFDGVVIVPPGSAPVFQGSTSAGEVVRLSDGCEVAGIRIEISPAVAAAGISGSEIDRFDIHDTVITGAFAGGIRIEAASGKGSIYRNRVESVSGGSGIALTASGTADLTADIFENTIRGASGPGLEVMGMSESRLTLSIAGNSIAGNGGAGIALQARGNSISAAKVSANILAGNTGPFAFDALAGESSTLCIELAANTADRNFRVIGNSGIPTRLFETGNSAPVQQHGWIQSTTAGGCAQ